MTTPRKDELRLQMAFAHPEFGDSTPFATQTVLHAHWKDITREMFAEAVDETARQFHDMITASAFMVSSTEQKRREISWMVAPKDPKEIITKDQTIAALRKAGDAMAEYLAPGPIPTSEPTARDFLLADWEQAKSLKTDK